MVTYSGHIQRSHEEKTTVTREIILGLVVSTLPQLMVEELATVAEELDLKFIPCQTEYMVVKYVIQGHKRLFGRYFEPEYRPVRFQYCKQSKTLGKENV